MHEAEQATTPNPYHQTPALPLPMQAVDRQYRVHSCVDLIFFKRKKEYKGGNIVSSF